jgi:hypothetical protein
MRSTKHLALPTYGVGALLVFLPLLDFVLSIFPIRLGDASWRFGAEGILSRALLTPVLGLLIWFLVASFLEHRLMLRLIVGICALIDLVLVVVVVSFILDSLQVRGQFTPEAKVAFMATAITALVKHGSFFLVSFALGAASWRRSRRLGPTKERERVGGPLLNRDATLSQKTASISA